MKKHLSVFLILILSSSVLEAQINYCNGMWTNRACDGEVQKTITEQPLRKRSPEEIKADKKLSLTHDLRSYAWKLRREYDIQMSEVDLVEDYCAREKVSVDQCTRKVTASYRALQAQERSFAKTKKKEARQGSSSHGGNVMIVKNENGYYRDRWRYRRYNERGHRRGHTEMVESGVSVSAGSADGRVKVGASSRSSSHNFSGSRVPFSAKTYKTTR